MTNVSFDEEDSLMVSRSSVRPPSVGLFIRLVFKLSAGRVTSAATAEKILLIVALLFFVLSGLILWRGL